MQRKIIIPQNPDRPFTIFSHLKKNKTISVRFLISRNRSIYSGIICKFKMAAGKLFQILKLCKILQFFIESNMKMLCYVRAHNLYADKFVLYCDHSTYISIQVCRSGFAALLE